MWGVYMFYAKEFCSYFQSGNLIEKTFFFCCCLVNAFFSVLIFWQVPIPTHPQARTYSEAVGTSSLFYIYGKAIFPLAFCIILKAAKIYFSYLCEYFLSFFWNAITDRKIGIKMKRKLRDLNTYKNIEPLTNMLRKSLINIHQIRFE